MNYLKQILSLLIPIMFFLMFVGIFYFFYLIVEPFNIPTLNPNPIPILNKDKIIHNGETISTKLNYCVYKKVSSITTRRIESVGEDRRVYFLATTVSEGNKPGCGKVISNTLPISADIPPGHYKIILVTSFKVNAFKEVSATYETETFTVRPKENK